MDHSSTGRQGPPSLKRSLADPPLQPPTLRPYRAGLGGGVVRAPEQLRLHADIVEDPGGRAAPRETRDHFITESEEQVVRGHRIIG